jgi:ribosomal protein L32
VGDAALDGACGRARGCGWVSETRSGQHLLLLQGKIQGRCNFLAEVQLRERGQPRSGALGMHWARREGSSDRGRVQFVHHQHAARRRPQIARRTARHTTMALARPLPPLWQSLFPALNGPVRPFLNPPLLQRLSQPFRTIPTPFAAFAIPALSLPSFPSLAEIWDGLLKAVPKKKTSYRKKRQRLMAGKGLKDITALTKCSACGRTKRAHLLCPYCVDGRLWSDWQGS